MGDYSCEAVRRDGKTSYEIRDLDTGELLYTGPPRRREIDARQAAMLGLYAGWAKARRKCLAMGGIG